MGEHLSKERQSEIFKQYGGDPENTGSTEGQIALFTERIKGLNEHLFRNPKDHSCRKDLLGLVGKRKRLLDYLAKKDIERYRELITELGIRK